MTIIRWNQFTLILTLDFESTQIQIQSLTRNRTQTQTSFQTQIQTYLIFIARFESETTAKMTVIQSLIAFPARETQCNAKSIRTLPLVTSQSKWTRLWRTWGSPFRQSWYNIVNKKKRLTPHSNHWSDTEIIRRPVWRVCICPWHPLLEEISELLKIN